MGLGNVAPAPLIRNDPCAAVPATSTAAQPVPRRSLQIDEGMQSHLRLFGLNGNESVERLTVVVEEQRARYRPLVRKPVGDASDRPVTQLEVGARVGHQMVVAQQQLH